MKNIFSSKVGSAIIAVIVCALWGSLYPFNSKSYGILGERYFEAYLECIK